MGGHDVIVVGLGAMGSAALWQAAARGASVLGIDQFSPPHQLGSSHGESRITRLAIGEGLAYVPLALRSRELFLRCEAETGADLLTITGGIVIGRRGVRGAHHGAADFLATTIAAAERFGIHHEVLSAEATSERFPQFRLAGDEVAYFEPDAGFLRPEACVDAQLTLAARAGAQIRRNERVESMAIDERGATVTTNQGRYSAAKVILTMGPWIGAMLDDRHGAHLSVYRQTMHWFAVSPPLVPLEPARCPVFIWAAGATKWFYGFPAIDGPEGGLKVATEQHRNTTSPDTVDRDVPEAESLALFDDLVGRRLPQLLRRRVHAVACLYTATADADFVIDWHPDSSDVLVVSPCSGHGFKHSAAIGEAAAQLVLDGASSLDLTPFAWRRFGGS